MVYGENVSQVVTDCITYTDTFELISNLGNNSACENLCSVQSKYQMLTIIRDLCIGCPRQATCFWGHPSRLINVRLPISHLFLLTDDTSSVSTTWGCVVALNNSQFLIGLVRPDCLPSNTQTEITCVLCYHKRDFSAAHWISNLAKHRDRSGLESEFSQIHCDPT